MKGLTVTRDGKRVIIKCPTGKAAIEVHSSIDKIFCSKAALKMASVVGRKMDRLIDEKEQL